MFRRIIPVLLFVSGISYAADPVIDSLKVELKKNLSPEERIDLTRRIGFVFLDNQIEFDSAFYYARQAYGIARNEDLDLQQAQTLFDQAMVMNEIGNYQQAIDFYKRSIEFSIKADTKKGIAFAYNNLGSIYGTLNDNESAKKSHDLAIQYAKEFDFPLLEAANLLNIGEILFDEGRLKEAMEHVVAGKAIYKEINHFEPSAQLYLAKIYLAHNKREKALEESKDGLTIAKDIRDLQLIYDHSIFLSEISAQNENYKEANDYTKLALAYHDSIASSEELNQVEKVMLKFKVQEQKNQLNVLEKENKYLNTIYGLAGIGTILLIVLVFRQLKIIRMTKDIHKVQNSLIKSELELRSSKGKSAFEAAVEEDKEFLKKVNV